MELWQCIKLPPYKITTATITSKTLLSLKIETEEWWKMAQLIGSTIIIVWWFKAPHKNLPNLTNLTYSTWATTKWWLKVMSPIVSITMEIINNLIKTANLIMNKVSSICQTSRIFIINRNHRSIRQRRALTTCKPTNSNICAITIRLKNKR